jgi:NADH-quinone oxidoreductase subunit J
MADILHDLVFVLFAAVTMGTAVLVVAFRNLLHAAVALFFCLTGVAALYILLGADFLGVAQLMIYAGGILVLIIFGVFLTSRIYGPTKLEVKERKAPAAIAIGMSVALFGLIWMVLAKTQWAPVRTPVYEPTTKQLGNLFLTRHLLAFELISILLLFVMVGSAILVRKEMERRK